MKNLTVEQKKQFSEILDELGENLDITETQFNEAVKSYNAVGEWLSKENTILSPYSPEILPQGSFMLGTMIRPINENDDLDIDLVCQLKEKNPLWTQKTLKSKTGDRLKENQIYKELLDDEGRRCWTLLYRENSDNAQAKYHMDILPCIVDKDYRIILESMFADSSSINADKLAIRITDKKEQNYNTNTNHLTWPKSNPFGYARWFFEQAKPSVMTKFFALSDSIKRVPTYSKNKLPLQRVIQILKRHRDMIFNGSDDKPISIIITTLAAMAYKKETNILDALYNIAGTMSQFIEEKYDAKYGRKIKWVQNPVNSEENFADKWPENLQKEKNFYNWLDKLQSDIRSIISSQGMQNIQESFGKPFGKELSQKVFCSYADKMKKNRESGNLKMATTGVLGSIGTTVKANHNFHGE